MGNASFVQTNFLGGEISQAAQGRMDLAEYKTALNVCLNGIPVQPGHWQRRPGTLLAGTTRNGARGRVIGLPFQQSAPFAYTMEFTDGFLRMWSGTSLVTANDSQTVTAISTANPAQVTTQNPHGWSSNNQVFFSGLGTNDALLQNRLFLITKIDNSNFTIADAITGATIDGSTLGAFVSGTVSRALEIATPYSAGSWASLRSVQSDSRTLLLNGTQPQVLQATTQPTPGTFATFSLGASNFIDGPYLDPIAGSQVTPSGGLNGVVTFTLSFIAYDATKAYNIGDFVTFNGQGYKSLTALNQGNEPDTHPANWTTVNGGAAVNNGQGFIPSDIGRLVRLLSEPPLWTPGTYGFNVVVAFADSNGTPAYWIVNNVNGTSSPPGSGTSWSPYPQGATWTWGQITSVSGAGLVSPATAIGNLTGGGGLAAAFDGNTTKVYASAANSETNITTFPVWSQTQNYSVNQTVQYQGSFYSATTALTAQTNWAFYQANRTYAVGEAVQQNGIVYQCIANPTPLVFTPPPPNTAFWAQIFVINNSPPPGNPAGWQITGNALSPTFDDFIGQHFAAPTTLSSVIFYPSTDIGGANTPTANVTLNFRAKATAPASPSDGTLLGSRGPGNNSNSPTVITSSDQASLWSYAWVEIVATYLQPLPDDGTHIFPAKQACSQVQFFSPNVSNGSVIQVQLRGPALLYNQTIRTWRAGVYSNTTGWPTCGCNMSGRVWLGGAVANRFDASVSNGFNGTQLDFTPTAPDGTVSDNNAISETLTGRSVNQILWMEPDQQGVICGTQAGETLIFAPSAGAITPTNIDSRPLTRIGCANVEPRRAEHTLVFVQRYQRKLMEAFPDVFSGKFTAPDLAVNAKHLTVSGIAEIAYQQEFAPTIWMRRNDGALVGATYKRDTLMTSQGPTINGWHRHALGSLAAARTVESITVGPSVDGSADALTMVTNDPTTGIRHVNVLGNLLDEGFTLTGCSLLDDAVTPSSLVVQLSPTGGQFGSLVVNGLWQLNGKTVTAFIAGLDCGDFTVASGSITIPFGSGIFGAGSTAADLLTATLVNSFPAGCPAVVGLTYTSQGQLCRPVTPQDTGARAGPGFAKEKRLHKMAAQVYQMVSGSMSVGASFASLQPAAFPNPNAAALTPQQPFSGIWRDDISGDYDFDQMLCWQIGRPLPGFVTAVGGFDATEDS